ncbi:MAG: putative beta-lysine N-acetyltransferase [Verrucomicrobia bacterium]|nr:putative beta-lysine N-acetyltransferase [Verrucomicrobiota bacterium]
MKLDPVDLPGLIDEIEMLARDHGYTKIFGKIRASARAAFDERGYVEEAAIPHFFNGADAAVFVAKFLDAQRAVEKQSERIATNLELARAKSDQGLPDGQEDSTRTQGSRDCSTSPADVEEMSRVYREVFPTYPFPIDDPAYLLKTMAANVQYFCVRDEGRIVALASAEKDLHASNAEMTDFATLPAYRRRGFAVYLLDRMEREIRVQGIRTAYTIARALSAGMNITFAKMGYAFAGTLVNNTNIAGKIESMNVWYKHLESNATREE